MKTLRSLASFVLIGSLLAVALVVQSGCKPGPPEKIATGKTLSSFELIAVAGPLLKSDSDEVTGEAFQFSSAQYAEINSKALPGFLDRYYSDLSKKGVAVSELTGSSGWDPRFNCTLFTDLYVGDMGAELYAALFYSNSPAVRPAIFRVWYHPDSAPAGVNHSITCICTEIGAVFVDPQVQTNGGRVTLSQTERHSIMKREA